jgi:hypothetical protein
MAFFFGLLMLAGFCGLGYAYYRIVRKAARRLQRLFTDET